MHHWIDLLVDSWMDTFDGDSWCYEYTRDKLVKTQLKTDVTKICVCVV